MFCCFRGEERRRSSTGHSFGAEGDQGEYWEAVGSKHSVAAGPGLPPPHVLKAAKAVEEAVRKKFLENQSKRQAQLDELAKAHASAVARAAHFERERKHAAERLAVAPLSNSGHSSRANSQRLNAAEWPELAQHSRTASSLEEAASSRSSSQPSGAEQQNQPHAEPPVVWAQPTQLSPPPRPVSAGRLLRPTSANRPGSARVADLSSVAAAAAPRPLLVTTPVTLPSSHDQLAPRPPSRPPPPPPPDDDDEVTERPPDAAASAEAERVQAQIMRTLAARKAQRDAEAARNGGARPPSAGGREARAAAVAASQHEAEQLRPCSVSRGTQDAPPAVNRRLAPADGERGPGDMPPEMRAAAAAAEAAVMAKFRASKEARDRAVRGGH